MCAHVQFQESCIKRWLLDMLVTLTLLDGVQVWGPSLYHKSRIGQVYDGWGSIEKPLVTMIAKMIQCKASVPHNIIKVEMNATPIVVEALTKIVSFIHHLWRLSQHKYHICTSSSQALTTTS